jgi:hypothetical protein
MEIATLTQYARHKDGTYVAILMDTISKNLLDVFTTQNLGLTEKVDPAGYHCTIIYSRTPVPAAETIKYPTKVVAHVMGYDVFTTKDGGKCLVMRLHCPQAFELNAALNKLGATSDYPEYKPHVTISYNYTGDIDPTKLPIPQFPLVFDDHEVSPLDPQFVPGNA